MWVGPLLHWFQASFHTLRTHFWVPFLHPHLLWMMNPLHIYSFFPPCMLVNSLFRSDLVFFAGCCLSSGDDVCWLWSPASSKLTLTIRLCLTSSLKVTKLSLNLGSRNVAVFNISCRCVLSYLCLRSSLMLSLSWRFRLLSPSSTVKVEKIFQLRGRTAERVVCFSPLRASV